MASIPVYGSQLIRFQETVPNVGANAVRAHRMVGIDQDAVGGAVLVEMGEVASATFTPIGVNQFEILAATDTSPAQSVRVASVATSGLLLVEIDTANAPVAGADLTVDTQGRASSAVGAVAVALNGSTPTVREVSGNFALVSFS